MFCDISVPPLITKPQRQTWKIGTGDSTTIECLAEASPGSQYVWKNAAGGVVSNDKHLRLNNVNDSKNGYYSCTATNSLDSDNDTILVEVTSKFHLHSHLRVEIPSKSDSLIE